MAQRLVIFKNSDKTIQNFLHDVVGDFFNKFGLP